MSVLTAWVYLPTLTIQNKEKSMITGAVSNHRYRLLLERISKKQNKVEPTAKTDNQGDLNERNNEKSSTAKQGK